MQAIRILLVEDDPGHQHLLTRILCDGRPNVQLVTASCKSEFAAAINQNEFDCVLIDFHLSDCQADELIELQRSLNRNFPAIVISGCDEQEIVIQSMRSGSVDFIHKDDAISGEHLWNRIEIVLEKHNQQNRERRRARRREKRLVEMAQRDHLTGLANRRALDHLIKGNGRGTFDRRGETSLVMMDIDHFKQINDRYGHACGDRAICAVANLIRSSLSRPDAGIRYGGEEFLVIRPGKMLENSVRWAEKLRVDIAGISLDENGETVAIKASFGVASVRSKYLGSDTITQADEALYLAKRRGRNQVCTSEMVWFDLIAAGIQSGNPTHRLDTALGQIDSRLGPTQRDHLTDHSERVSQMASQIGERLGMLDEDVERLRFSGLCHDLGKMYIPERILAKPSRLSDDETFLVSRHAMDGAEITKHLCDDAIAAKFVQHHHDRFDETCEETFDDIPLGARILNVADAFVTMTSGRPYQSACSPESALRELKRHRGKQFDPMVVDAVVNESAAVLC